MNRFILILSAVATQAVAQPYPAKPIHLIVPFAPGGSSEFVARTVSAEMAKGLGQNFVIENKPGGGGNIAMQEVARAEPDGYTLIIGHIGTLAANPFMSRELPYDANRDFAPISLLVKVVTLYVVHAEVPAKDLKELVALATKDPGKLNYGSAGNASAGHLAMEYLKLATGMDIQHVPYKGTGPMVIDLVAGRTQVGVAGTPPLLQHVRSGKLRAVAIGTPERIAVLPEVRSVAEQGYPGFETSQWYGLIGPAKMPEALVRKLADEAAKAMKSKPVLDRLATESAIAVGSTPQEFAAFIAKEQARWKEVVQKAHIKAD
jgi:tripartite-type tricarboxylate transporter receptor subunit TctC